LFCRFEAGGLGFHCPYDILQITNASSQPVDPGNHQAIALPKEIENDLKFGPAFGGGAASLFRSNNITPRRLQGRNLNFEILVSRRYSGIADVGQGPSYVSRMSLDHTPFCIRNQDTHPIETALLSHRSAQCFAPGIKKAPDNAGAFDLRAFLG
jgi:hypothetical protein